MPGTGRQYTAKLSLILAATDAVCYGQMPPIDSANYAARAVTVTGQVSVLRDSQPLALMVGDLVQVKQLIMTGPDGSAKFQVSDGSTFEVYPNSQVVFRKNAPNWKDLLDVLVGRVRVHIEHLMGNQPNPNRVLTPTAVISVRGTTFDISVEDEEETTLVEVEEGLVEVQHALLPRGNPKMLSTGESIKVYKREPLASSMIDKGEMFRRVFHAAMDAVTTWGTRTPRSTGGVGGSSGPSVGDSKAPAPPASPGKLPPLSPSPLPPHLLASDSAAPVAPPRHNVAHKILHFLSRVFLSPDPTIDIR